MRAICSIVGVFVVLFLFGACASTSEENTSAGNPAAETPANPETTTEEEITETKGQENARLAAEAYLDTFAFSQSGLIEQLRYEGYSRADAEYAVSVVKVDWKQQAALAAQAYLDTMPFSRTGLIEQLEFEGFTPAQAAYGVKKAGL